ncbi:MAG: PAS domain-containing protein [Flavobacterium sp.]|nr:PAS domain-containing protein [Flavobacterium sp.]
MKNIKYRPSIYHKIILSISLLILLLIGLLAVNHINNISKSTKSLIHSYEVNLELERLFSNIRASENNMRGYLLSGNSFYLRLYRGNIEKVNTSYLLLKDLTKDNPIQQQNLDSLNKIIELWQRYIISYSNFNKNFDIKTNSTFQKNFHESTSLLIDIRNKVNEMAILEKSYLKQRNLLYNSQIYRTPILTVSVLLATLLVLIFAYYQNTKDLDTLQNSNTKLNKYYLLNYQAEILSEFGTWEGNLNDENIILSDNLYRILGVEPRSFEANKSNFMKFVHFEDVEIVNNFLKKILAGLELPPTYHRIIRPDGDIRIFRSVGKLFVDNLGNKSVLGVTGDVTVEQSNIELLKSNYHDLVKVNNQLKIFDESSKQAEILGKYGSWILNFDTLKFIYSDNTYRLLGCEPQSFEPSLKNLIEFVHPDDKLMVNKAFKKALCTMEIPAISYRIIKKNGKIRKFKTNAKSILDIKGIQNMIGTTQDITEDYSKSMQLKLRNKELEKHINELNEFNQVASHDLQEPLRKIQTFISRINNKDKEMMSEMGREYLTRMEKASNRMRVLINDLLQYSRANRAEKSLVKIDLNEVLSNSLVELSQNIEDTKAVITYSDLPIIDGIDFQMQQLFTNLLSNSLKYSKANSAPIIHISYREIFTRTESILKDKSTKKYYKINFVDNGIGFEQENAEKIFLLFNRLRDKTEFQGTGVGLAICKKIVENHNGCIFAKSEPNEGATFTIFMPMPIS